MGSTLSKWTEFKLRWRLRLFHRKTWCAKHLSQKSKYQHDKYGDKDYKKPKLCAMCDVEREDKRRIAEDELFDQINQLRLARGLQLTAIPRNETEPANVYLGDAAVPTVAEDPEYPEEVINQFATRAAYTLNDLLEGNVENNANRQQ